MKKKLWKQKISTVLVCASIISIVNTNATFTSHNGKDITIDNLPVKANNNKIKETSIKENINEEGNFPELKRGQIVSVESISGDDTKLAIMSNGDLYC